MWGSRTLVWDDIQRFEIRSPTLRTPFMLAFRWWADQAHVVLRDGTKHRIRAIEPWHGFTVLTYFSISSWTKADMNVETLEELRQTSAHSSVPALGGRTIGCKE
jgi:hypothetical protein